MRMQDYYGVGTAKERYFTQHGIEIEVVFESQEAVDQIRATSTPNIWVFYQSSSLPPDIDILESDLRERGYQLRQIAETGKDTVIDSTRAEAASWPRS